MLNCKITQKGYKNCCQKDHDMGSYLKAKVKSSSKKCICLISSLYENTNDFHKKVQRGLFDFVKWDKIIKYIK